LQLSKAPPPPIVSAAPPPAPAPAPAPAQSLVTEPVPAPDFETPAIASAFGDSDRISDRAEAPRPMSNPNLRKVVPSVPPPPAQSFELDVAALDRLPSKPALPNPGSTTPEPASVRPLRKSNPPARKLRPNTAPAAPPPPSLSRPSSRFAAAPSKSSQSIFGDGVISEQSLDEVILSYLAEDLDGSSD
jgi:hypothetical protein